MLRSKLIESIERLREEINEIAEKKGFLHKETLKKSKKLDKLLNKYNKQIKKTPG